MIFFKNPLIWSLISGSFCSFLEAFRERDKFKINVSKKSWVFSSNTSKTKSQLAYAEIIEKMIGWFVSIFASFYWCCRRTILEAAMQHSQVLFTPSVFAQSVSDALIMFYKTSPWPQYLNSWRWQNSVNWRTKYLQGVH